MKKILALSFVFTAFVFASQAQVQRQSKGIQKTGSHHKGNKMEGLNLTESQKADIKIIREEQKAQLETLKSSGQSQADMDKQRKAIMETYKGKIQNVLTAEQIEKMKEQRMNKKEDKIQKGEKLKQDLNLSNDQAAKMQSINANTKAKLQEIRSNTTLTKEQKKEQIKALHQQAVTDRKSILNEEQIKKMDERNKENMQNRREGKRRGKANK